MRPARLTMPHRSATVNALATGQREQLPLWELVFLLLASLNYWTDLLRLMFPGTDSISVVFRAVQFGFYGAFAALLMRDLPAIRDTVRRMPFMVALLAMPLVSVLWSVDPGETMTRAVALFGSSLFAIYVAAQVSPRLALRILAWTGGICAAISIVLIFAFPSIGLMSEGEYVNVWSGAFIHKNGLGQMTALGSIISMIVLMSEGVRQQRLIAVGLLLNLFLLAGSRSLTSQMVVVASVVMILTVGRFLRFLVRNGPAILMVIAPVALVLIATVSLDDLMRLLESAGKSPTMSSRLPLWQELMVFIADRPLLGWGYEAFFTNANYAYRIISAKLHFTPYYAHNGYLEILIGLGTVGLLMLTMLFVRFSIGAARRLYLDDRDPMFLLCFVYVFVFLIQNAAEATILQRNSMSWSLFVLLYGFLVRTPIANEVRIPHSETQTQSGRLRVA